MHHVTIKATVSLSHGAMAAIGLSAALKEQLTCSICLDVFTEPKTLQCLHSFCLPCLKKMAAKSPSDAPLRCPDCREDIRLPPEASLDTLPHSFYFDRLLKLLAMQEQSQSPSANICSCNRNSSPTGFCFDCEQFLCDECLNAHNFVAFLKGHRRLAVNQFQDADLREFLERPEKCKIEYHEKDKLEYFCEDCKSSICQKCALLEHRGHQYVYIRKAADQCKEGLRESVNKVKAKIPAVEERMKNAEESLNAGKQKIERVKGEVEERVEILIQLLRQHKHSVISELEGIEINETSRYEAKRCDLETRMAQLKSGVEFVDALLDRNLSNEIVDIHDSVIERCAELEADGGQNPEENHVEIEYKAPEVFTVTTAKFAPGRLLAPGFLDPSRSTIEGELKEAVVGQRAQFVVVTRDSQGKACSYGGDCVEVTVRSSTGEAVESTVLDKGDGRYEVHYTPQAVGRSEVVVEMSGRAVGGSPFEVQVVWEFKSLKTFGQAGSGAGEFNGPWGVAVSSMLGHVAVSDCNNHSIQLFTGDGQHLRTIGSRGSEKGQLLWPTGIAFDLQDRILVADDNHRIQVLTTAGQSLGTFGEKNLKHPLGICVTNEGNIAVCSQREKRGVKLFKPNGSLSQTFDDSSRKSSPLGVTFSSGKFYVSYCHGHGLSVFGSDGTLVFSVGEPGQGAGQFNGVAVDQLNQINRLLVCDPQHHRIQVFTTEGQLIQKTGSEGTAIGQFLQPMGIASSPTGRIYVSEMRGNRVQIMMFG